MKTKEFNEILEKVKKLDLKEEFDLVVCIARWWVVPGFLISQYLKIPLEIIYLNLRNDEHEMIREEASLLRDINFEYKNKRIILVDDVTRTGNTFKKAKEVLQWTNTIKTLSFNGEADYSLYKEECFIFPWLIK